MMRITVAVACYNLEDRIATCLESIISQDYKDIEILVVDDCSTDGSIDVVNNLIEKHPDRDCRLIVNETNLGLCKVRNISIDEARGDAIFFMDGDDTIEPGTISMFQRRMEETDVDVVCGSFRKVDPNGNAFIIKQFPDDTFKGYYAYASYIKMHVEAYFSMEMWNRLCRLDFLRSNNIYCATNYRKHEGSLFVYKVVLYAQSVSYLHDITYNWFNNLNGIANNNIRDKRFLDDFRFIIESVIAAKNEFESCQKNQALHAGIRFLTNYILLTMGFLKFGLESEVISKKEKQQFLKWLKGVYHDNDMNLSNIVGPYNRISYLILISPFPFPLFRFYFRHLKLFVRMIEATTIADK